VEADSEGISLNPEEKKMGIKGSSTRQVFFNNVKVPVENMLSERENGFKIAINILNIGRIKLAAGVLGGAKATIKRRCEIMPTSASSSDDPFQSTVLFATRSRSKPSEPMFSNQRPTAPDKISTMPLPL
jgi:alkylation response protein AidB-like acyl-CoA dehydrogenase